uniref:Uncharacterized protein n=1 Tax=Alexandrium monilatum TaxID=311494 RepID=A0A7S4SU21_9DINO|mmetsp:Transcript_110551/g.345647  ORF Transcript_110551/g.345647 Transcript_110551/m.345647 type:complete len:467 (+) Transcript_110551:53-1453(+)
MAGQARASGSAEIAGDSELREKKAALRQAGKRLPRSTGATAEPDASAGPSIELVGQNGMSLDTEAAASKRKKRRRTDTQSGPAEVAEGDDGAGAEPDAAAAPPGQPAGEAAAAAASAEPASEVKGDGDNFLGVRREGGTKAMGWLDREGRRIEMKWVDVVPRKVSELPEAGSEVRLPSTITHPDVLHDAPGEEEDFGEGSWRPGLEELRRTVRPREPEPGEQEPPLADDLVTQVRTAIQTGDWHRVLDPARVPQFDASGQAVGELREEELLQLLRACNEHIRTNPRAEIWCFMWAERVVAWASLRLGGRQEFREEARPLLEDLAGRLGPTEPGRGIASTVGRWRLVLELARVRRQAAKLQEALPEAEPKVGAGARAAAPAATRAAPSNLPHVAEPDSSDESSDEAGNAAREEDAENDAGMEDDNEEADRGAADGEDGGGAQVRALKALHAEARAGAATNGPRKRLR